MTLLGFIKHPAVGLIRRQRFSATVHQSYRTKATLTKPVFLQSINSDFHNKIAIRDNLGSHTYDNIQEASKELSRYALAYAKRDVLLVSKRSGRSSVVLNGERIAFLCPNNVSYVISQWATWMCGGMAVPLCRVHPPSEWEYVMNDSQCSLLISTKDFAEQIDPIARTMGINHLVLDTTQLAQVETENLNDKADTESLIENEDYSSVKPKTIIHDENTKENIILIDSHVLQNKWRQIRWGSRNALLLYTSGTTGRPKGVVLTFASIEAQVTMMLKSWGWSQNDVILHVLPLHHVHGLINVLLCPLWCGATCVMHPSFSAEKVWDQLLDSSTAKVNVFMAVPTIYAKLIDYFHKKNHAGWVRAFIKAFLSERIRLMVSGSAALPQPIMDRWKDISGHELLERYGMTELGMVLSNPLYGERVPGAVGNPLPTVKVRITLPDGRTAVTGNSFGSTVTPGLERCEGELEVKGPAILKEYWNRREATTEAFTSDGWFKTGDTAVYENNVYKIRGRTSVDIIKSGGYKISALDVERHLLSHPSISQCVVVGLPDVTWGQRVAAVVVLKEGKILTMPLLREWASTRMPHYIMPSQLKIVEEIPKNAMGKVNKKELVGTVFGID